MYHTYKNENETARHPTHVKCAVAVLALGCTALCGLALSPFATATHLMATTTTKPITSIRLSLPAPSANRGTTRQMLLGAMPKGSTHIPSGQATEPLEEGALPKATWLAGALVATGVVAFLVRQSSVLSNSGTDIAMMTTTANQKDVDFDYDALIAQMVNADEGTLELLVAQSMPALKTPFFLRVEALANAATDAAEKQRLTALIDRVLGKMKAVVDAAQSKVNEQSIRISGLLGIFSEEDGTIAIPLAPAKVARLREVVRGELSAMSNDIFVNAILAFMAKAGEDKKLEVIEVLQKILQAYAAESLLIMCPHGGEGAAPENIVIWNTLLNTEFEQWEDILRREFFTPGGKDLDSFVNMLDTGVGAVVYEQSKGSIQQVLAQYVFQIIQRINKLKEAK